MANEPLFCPHIASVLADRILGDVIIKKYKSVVAWNAYRSLQVNRQNKRRKVCFPSLCVYFLMLMKSSDICADMWNL